MKPVCRLFSVIRGETWKVTRAANTCMNGNGIYYSAGKQMMMRKRADDTKVTADTKKELDHSGPPVVHITALLHRQRIPSSRKCINTSPFHIFQLTARQELLKVINKMKYRYSKPQRQNILWHKMLLNRQWPNAVKRRRNEWCFWTWRDIFPHTMFEWISVWCIGKRYIFLQPMPLCI